MVVNLSPLVSIVTPVYNGSDYLQDLIRSVEDQDYPEIEHVIIDDGSQDNGATLAILRQHPRLRWQSRANQGQYATMNEGLMAARGEIVCFVSADDIVSPGAVSAAVDFLRRQSRLDGVFGTTGRIDSQGRPLPYFIPFRTAPLALYPYFAHISHCSLYMRKEPIIRAGLLFNPSLKYVGDYDWIIRIYRAGLKVGLLRRQLSRVRMHADQTSQKYSRGSQAETRKVIEDHQINKLSFGFLNGLYRFLFKAWYVTRLIRKGETTMFIRHQIHKPDGR
jgi:glycosyltransferase involved in cell wall biosynthesis